MGWVVTSEISAILLLFDSRYFYQNRRIQLITTLDKFIFICVTKRYTNVQKCILELFEKD